MALSRSPKIFPLSLSPPCCRRVQEAKKVGVKSIPAAGAFVLSAVGGTAVPVPLSKQALRQLCRYLGILAPSRPRNSIAGISRIAKGNISSCKIKSKMQSQPTVFFYVQFFPPSPLWSVPAAPADSNALSRCKSSIGTNKPAPVLVGTNWPTVTIPAWCRSPASCIAAACAGLGPARTIHTLQDGTPCSCNTATRSPVRL